MEVKGLLFFDYDGTLADERENIYVPSDEVKAAIEKLRRRGYAAVLATGRAKCYADGGGIDFDGFVTSNGAYAEIFSKTVLDTTIDEELLREFTQDLEKENIFYALERQDICYRCALEDPRFDSTLELFNINPHVFVRGADIKRGANKLFISCGNTEAVKRLNEKYSGRLVIERHRTGVFGDVGIYGITKACGVEAIIGATGAARENTYAFGDGVNDRDMLKTVAHGVAMKEHKPCLDSVAELVTDSVKNNGIVKAMEYFGLL